MQPDDRLTILLYFYSTVPQVLGAILAITGAFAVFQSNSFKDEIRATSQELIDLIGPTGPYRVLMIEAMGDPEVQSVFKLLKYNQISFNINGLEKASLTLMRGICKKSVKDKKEEIGLMHGLSSTLLVQIALIHDFKKKTKQTFLVNGFIIIILIAAFLLIPLLSKITITYWIGLSMGIFVTTFSLVHILGYIILSLDSHPERNSFGFRFKLLFHRPRIIKAKKKKRLNQNPSKQ